MKDGNFDVGWTRGFRWIHINGKNALVEKREAVVDRNGSELSIYVYRYTIYPNGNDGCLTFAFVIETTDFDLAIAEQREFVESVRLVRIQE